MRTSLFVCLSFCLAVQLDLTSAAAAAPRIVGGEDAVVGEFPWLVWLGRGIRFVCHGSLIREDLVLTSRTCHNSLKSLGAYRAYIGVGNRNWESNINPWQKIRVMSKTKIKTLVVLKLRTAANIQENAVKNVNVIPVATREDENSIIGNGNECILAGWGWKAKPNGKGLVRSPKIQKLDIKFIDRSNCLRINRYDKKTELCYKVSETEGPCDFDDGAPIACKKAGQWVLVAVDTGKRKKNRNSNDYNVRCRGGLVAPIRVSEFYSDIEKRLDDVYDDASTKNYPKDCAEAKEQGLCSGPSPCNLSLKRTYGYKEITAVCDQTTDGGGWTIFQRRFDGSVDFYKKFKKYEYGFGSKTGEYWLGLKWIDVLTENGLHEMRIDLMNHLNETAFQLFSSFKLAGGFRKYRLNVGSSTGTAGDNGGFELDNGSDFTTFDNDQDSDDEENLAEMFHTGWWLPNASGSFVNLNGNYGVPGDINLEYTPPGGFTHIPWNDLKMLEASTMMVRKA